jgi:predicted outer membrane repeat protein
MKPRLLTTFAFLIGLLAALTLLDLLTGPATPVNADPGVLYVAPGGNCGGMTPCYAAIQAAVDAASNGDTISITAGTYNENITITGKVLTFLGAGAGSTIVDGSGTGRVFYSDGDITLADLTIQNGNTTSDGGGIYAADALILTNVNVLSNTVSSGWGGGAYAGGAVTLSGGLFQNNQSNNSYGGGLYANSTLALTGTQFISNTVAGSGGGLYIRGTAQFTNGYFQNNGVSGSGGGVYVYDSLAMTDTRFISNTAAEAGGAYVEGNVTLTGGSFEYNSGTYIMSLGGGLHVERTLIMTGTQFISNKANSTGGGAFVYGVAELWGGRFEGNSSGHCGGLYASILTLTGTQFISNTADVNAGGVFAITATLNGGRFENNRCTGTNCQGGGLEVSDTLILTGTQFIRNTANGNGGGLYALGYYGGSGRVVNALFARNSAGSNGAALYLFDPFSPGGNADILHTTIASPTIGTRQAIYVGKGTVNITNTIIASHTTDIAVNSGAVVNLDYSLFTHNPVYSGTVNTGAHVYVGNPAFVNPGTDDYHLTSTSAAIDRGVDVGVYDDIEGQPRPMRFGFDIGAYELPPPPFRVFLPLVLRSN